MNAFAQLQLNLARNAAYEAEGDDVPTPVDVPVRLFAFYLPQFHPIPENDAWWGRGFTEWTNVTRALPRFRGHYQPHLPADLGFYDLRLPDALRAQVDLARRYGITGFCFHWYWFGGRRLLERPLDNFLADRSIDFPFFINWANENWTRRWDGKESEILLEQPYGADADLALADAFLDIVRDPRYLRIDGRPVIMIYRPSAIPDAAASVARWRAHFAARGEANPLLMMAQTFGDYDPAPYGMDDAVQFPIHGAGNATDFPQDWYDVFDSSYGGRVYDYEKVVDHLCTMRESGPKAFHCVCPGWDNEARRPNAGTVLAESTPRKYGRWLARALAHAFDTASPSRRLVFVNAWNEWAEGAHLEPDLHFGHAYLRETARALDASRDRVRLDAFIAARAHETAVQPMDLMRAKRLGRRMLRRLRR